MINLKNILLHTIFILFVSCCGTGGCAFFNKVETRPQIENEDLPNKQNKQELIVEEKAQPQVKMIYLNLLFLLLIKSQFLTRKFLNNPTQKKHLRK